MCLKIQNLMEAALLRLLRLRRHQREPAKTLHLWSLFGQEESLSYKCQPGRHHEILNSLQLHSKIFFTQKLWETGILITYLNSVWKNIQESRISFYATKIMFTSVIILEDWEGGLVKAGLIHRKLNQRPFTVPCKVFPSSS